MIGMHQPQFMPWIGYFDKIDKSEIFVLLDKVQFKKNEWQNRNKIKGPNGWQWFTVPVTYSFGDKIKEVHFADDKWKTKHLKTLRSNYSRAKHFKEVFAIVEDIYSNSYSDLADLNTEIIVRFCGYLGISTYVCRNPLIDEFDDPDDRIIAIMNHFRDSDYLAGSGGKEYMDMKKYADAKIKINIHRFQYKQYTQLFGEFIPNLSILDLMFNHGKDSLSIIRSE